MRRPTTLVIAALGGQGGGVVADWLIDVARRERHIVQATSVPGVAQRTGTTIYYLEFFAESELPADGRRPVMALMPSPGDVDIVLAAEALESGRAVQRGFVTPERTTLIASTHRVYTIDEKSSLGDGRADADAIAAHAASQARRCVAFDMAAIAERSGALISAVLLGALAGADVLPFREQSWRDAIRASAKAVDANLAAFDAGMARAREAAAAAIIAAPTRSSTRPAPREAPSVPAPLAARIAGFPSELHEVLTQAVARLVDYQDAAYAAAYLDRVARVAALEPHEPGDHALSRETARRLALWMSFEDTIRVADLKTRAGRHARIRSEVRARAGDIVTITEYLKPRVEELCGTLPARLGARLLASPSWRRRLGSLTGDRAVNTSTVTGFALLRGVAALRRFRRGTLRYGEEQARIEDWLGRIARYARRDYALAVEIAACQGLVKGYGETHERGLASYGTIVEVAERIAGRERAGDAIRQLRVAALADERGEALRHALADLDQLRAVPADAAAGGSG
jgi:indolepyruvate ferredoxin oxidoreductase beta subunit